MAVPLAYRLVIVNNSGETLSYTPGGRLNTSIFGWFIDPSTGKVTYSSVAEAEESPEFDGASETIVDGAEVIFPEQLNTGNKHLGLLISFALTHDEHTAVVANASMDLYISAGLATGQLPTDKTGYAGAEANGLQRVGSMVVEPSGSDDNVTFSNVFNL